jgi:hypothetical protein
MPSLKPVEKEKSEAGKVEREDIARREEAYCPT